MTRREFLAFMGAISVTSPAMAFDEKMRRRVMAETEALFRTVAPSFVGPNAGSNVPKIVSNDWTKVYSLGEFGVDYFRKYKIQNEVVAGLYFDRKLIDMLGLKSSDSVIFCNEYERRELINKLKNNKTVKYVIISGMKFYSPVFNRDFTRAALVIETYIYPEKTSEWVKGDKIPTLEFTINMYFYKKKQGKLSEIGVENIGVT